MSDFKILRTAKEMKQAWGYKYNPLPEAVELVDTMIDKCRVKRASRVHILIIIRDLKCVIIWPKEDDGDVINDIPRIVDCLLFYHRDVFHYPNECHCHQTKTEKSLRTTGFKFVEKYLDKYHSDYHDKTELYADYYDR